MRVRLHARSQDERGAVLVIVAVTMTALIGAAAFAVDAGAAWQAKRRLHTATDAAALAAAQEYVAGNNGCSTTDDTYVTKNDPDASVTECSRVGSSDSGYVTVSATSSVEFQFAKIFGVDDSDIGSSTTAAYGSPLSIIGLRPIAICMNYPALQEWLDPPNGPTGPSEPIVIPQTNANIGCDNAPGNWGWLDLDDGNGGGANQLEEDLRNGSEEAVAVPGFLEPKPGNVASTADALDDLVAGEVEFPVPLFDFVDGEGKNARFHAVGVATVKLTDWGSDFFEFIFTPKTIQGTCCSEDGINTGTKVVNICAVNADKSGCPS